MTPAKMRRQAMTNAFMIPSNQISGTITQSLCHLRRSSSKRFLSQAIRVLFFKSVNLIRRLAGITEVVNSVDSTIRQLVDAQYCPSKHAFVNQPGYSAGKFLRWAKTQQGSKNWLCLTCRVTPTVRYLIHRRT